MQSRLNTIGGPWAHWADGPPLETPKAQGLKIVWNASRPSPPLPSPLLSFSLPSLPLPSPPLPFP